MCISEGAGKSHAHVSTGARFAAARQPWHTAADARQNVAIALICANKNANWAAAAKLAPAASGIPEASIDLITPHETIQVRLYV